jgi:hypothetical protein
MPRPVAPVADHPLATLLAGLGAQADVLRAVATRAGLLAGALAWRSAGARGFDDQVAALSGALRAAADRLDTLPELAVRPAPSRFPAGAPRWPGGP